MSSWAEEALQSFESLTAEQRLQHREDRIKEKKEQIASLASAVVSDPHGNVRCHQCVLQAPPHLLLYIFLCSADEVSEGAAWNDDGA